MPRSLWFSQPPYCHTEIMQVGVYSFQFYKMTYTSNFSVRVDIYLKISQFFFNVAIMFRVALNPLVFAK